VALSDRVGRRAYEWFNIALRLAIVQAVLPLFFLSFDFNPRLSPSPYAKTLSMDVEY
jgi:hypothetical protein